MTASADLLDWPLHGVCLIEASAGTGKTWTICGLYLRLLIEGRRKVRDLLVVTFTTAATAELKERIRARLADLQRALRVGTATSDSFIAAYLARLEADGPQHIDRDELQRCIDEALHQFDEAAIYTIHGFCQRALSEAPFAAGLPFAFEVLQGDGALVRQVATDFYRSHVVGARYDDQRSARLRHRLTPDRLTALLSQRLGRPLDRLEFATPGPAGGFDHYCAIFAAAAALWRTDRERIMDVLRDGAPGNLNATSYKPLSIEAGGQAVDALLGQPYALAIDADDKTRALRAAHLRERTNGGKITPVHPFFELLQQLLDASPAADAELDDLELVLITELLRQGPASLHAQKRRQRVISFNDMLGNLRDALIHPSLTWLASALRARYPVALIDEFQDTDPLQFEIFSRIYQPADAPADAAGPLFLVGDPKQAIYRFRGADLFTYLKAARQAAQRYSLSTNQRSVAPLIAAQNALFGCHARSFVLDDLHYQPVMAGNRQRPPLVDADLAGGTDSALVLWSLPSDLLPKGQADQQVIAATTSEIVRLLNAARAGHVTIGARPLAAGDIAVIVRSHAQGQQIKQALQRRGIASVERTQDNVFQSTQARQFELFLLALSEPGNERALNAALSSSLFGLDATQIDAENNDESRRAERLAAFAQYRQLWQQRGFAAMWRQVQADGRLLQRLLPLPDGDRQVTNFLHLGELLHLESDQQAGSDGLARWIQQMRNEKQASETMQLRLESDEHLVQITTLHASKGLEFAVTFCPFLWLGSNRPSEEALRASYHDDDGNAVTRYARDNTTAEAHETLENFAETVRNLYVALTRAVYRIYLVAGLCNYGKDKGRASRASALNWLVAGGGTPAQAWLDQPAEAADIEAAWSGFARQLPASILHQALPPGSSETLAASSDERAGLVARTARRAILPGWTQASFTSLNRNTWQPHQAAHVDEGGAGDGRAADHDHDQVLPVDEARPQADRGMMAFPRGAEPGTLLHAVFEHADFSRPQSWDAAIERALQRHPLRVADLDADASAPVLRDMLRGALLQVSTADLTGQGLQLAQVKPHERLNELDFTLPAHKVQPGTLAALLRAAGEPLELSSPAMLNGYLRGAIDCIFRLDGRYWIADWKSNHLGTRLEDYQAPALRQAVLDAGYGLQYILYTLALHRYLRLRLSDYDYERDVGGVFYVFVRGVVSGWQQTDGSSAGIYRARPARALIEQLDLLFETGAIR